MASVPPARPDRIDPQEPPGVEPVPAEPQPEEPPETTPPAPDIDEPDRGPDETPPPEEESDDFGEGGLGFDAGHSSTSIGETA